VDLAAQDCHIVAQHHDFDREGFVTAAHEPNQSEDSAKRPGEEREGHRRMFSGTDALRQSAAHGPWMKFSAQTGVIHSERAQMASAFSPVR
jgi:hypothetical protein